MVLGDRDVERPCLGVVLDLALLAVLAGLGSGCHVPSKAAPKISRQNKGAGGKPMWV